MQKMIQRYLSIVLLMAATRASWGFSLLGPLLPDAGGEPWQVVTIGYNMAYEMDGILPGGPVWLGDVGGPHNLGEEYRRNVPVLYYSYDASFLAGDYFGTNGTVAIDSAFAVINNLTNLDSYNADLSQFPLNSQHINYTAQSLYLTDLKSATLHLLVEQLGLADPARFSWTLHDRDPGPACPVTATYLVVQRNFDWATSPSLQSLAYSPYVNGTLLSYYITEHCSGPPPDLAITVPFLVDSTSQEYAPVAANNFQESEEFNTSELFHIPTIYGLGIGGYYTGLTRDDVAGLRYLYSTNNVNVEPVSAQSQALIITTNFNSQVLFPNPASTNAATTGTNGTGFYYYDGTYGYGDYGALVAASKTNSPAVMQALYPGLVISSSSNYFAIATNQTVVSYYTNFNRSPINPPILVVATNYSYYLQEYFVSTFANVMTNHYSPTTVLTVQTTTFPYYPSGSAFGNPPQTNVSSKKIILNAPSGDFFLLPASGTNICPLDIAYVGLTNVFSLTNVLTTANTNVATSSNTTFYSSSISVVSHFTNYTFVVYPVTCGSSTNPVASFQGIGGVRFVRQDYDSLIGQYWQPVTNYYTMYYVTNYLLHASRITRVITQPDILLAAADMADGPAGINFNRTVVRNINFNSSQEIAGLHGPGIIDSPSVFTYNKVGSVFENGPFTDANSYLNPNEVNETTQVPLLQWASFDGSTNAPVVYPNGTSVQNIENQMIVQVAPSSIPNYPAAYYATNGVQFSVQSGPFTPPYTWKASGVIGEPGSGLPSGLTLTPNGLLHGVTGGVGTYDFTLTLTDGSASPRSVQWNYSLTLQ